MTAIKKMKTGTKASEKAQAEESPAVKEQRHEARIRIWVLNQIGDEHVSDIRIVQTWDSFYRVTLYQEDPGDRSTIVTTSRISRSYFLEVGPDEQVTDKTK